MLTNIRTVSARWRYVAVLMIAGLALAACASSKTATAAATGGTSSAGSGAAVVMTKSGPDGTYLTDGSGRTLYLFVPDTNGKSTCTGTCAKFWPPLQTTGTPTAGAGVTASMFSTFMRSDGTTQVVYNGHPLYYYLPDTAPGQMTGQGLNQSGGLWWLVSPAGNAIQHK